MKRIHIVGSGPRTGTTLMAEMMIACFEIDVHSGHEDSLSTLPPRRGKVYLTKRPRDVVCAGPALRLVPDLHVIYMLRDPRDVIVSVHGRDRDRYWAGLAFWKYYAPHGRRLRGHPRLITVRYEDLVREPNRVQQQLMDRLPFLKRKADFTRYHELSRPSADALGALGGVRPLSVDRIGNWRRHLPRVAGQLQLHGPIGRDLIEHGYETDEAWLGALAGIAPDLRSSHWPEMIPRRWRRQVALTRHLVAVATLLGHYEPTSSLMRGMAWPFHRRSRLGGGGPA